MGNYKREDFDIHDKIASSCENQQCDFGSREDSDELSRQVRTSDQSLCSPQEESLGSKLPT